MKRGYLIIDHGSRRAASNQQLEDMAARVAALRPDACIAFAHMEIAEPDIAHGVDELVQAGVEHIEVLLYFLSNGRHVTEDVPQLMQEAMHKHPTISHSIGQALGPHDMLAELLLKRSAESA